jgi:hypothetical protein
MKLKMVFILLLLFVADSAWSQSNNASSYVERNGIRYYEGPDQDTVHQKLNLVVPENVKRPRC